MTKFLPVVVTLFLLFLFLIVNQAIISNQSLRNSGTISATDNSPISSAVPVDNDQRGAHSYFLSPRIFSNRYVTDNKLAINLPQKNIENLAHPSSQIRVPLVNDQDLLQAGYLMDSRTSYKPDFGVSSKD